MNTDDRADNRAIIKNVPEGREPTWKELDDHLKIEKLRQAVKAQEEIITKMASFLNQLLAHEHCGNRLVKPLDNPNAESYGGFHYRKRMT